MRWMLPDSNVPFGWDSPKDNQAKTGGPYLKIEPATGRMGSIRLLYSTAAFNRTRKARCDANTKLSLSLMPIQLQGEHNMNAASCGAFKIKVDLHLQYSTAMRIQVHHVYSTVS